jgi:hypothetical protein
MQGLAIRFFTRVRIRTDWTRCKRSARRSRNSADGIQIVGCGLHGASPRGARRLADHCCCRGCFSLSHLRGIPDVAGILSSSIKSQKPAHISGGFNAHDRRRQARLKLRTIVPSCPRSLDDVFRPAIQRSRSSVAPRANRRNNQHLGLVRPERCEGDGHRTVYLGRREADVVMTFWIRHMHPPRSGKSSRREGPSGSEIQHRSSRHPIGHQPSRIMPPCRSWLSE